jgi:hypothetical protein
MSDNRVSTAYFLTGVVCSVTNLSCQKQACEKGEYSGLHDLGIILGAVLAKELI